MNRTLEDLKAAYQMTKSIRKAAAMTGYSKSGAQWLLDREGVTCFPANRSGVEASSHKAVLNLPDDNPRRLSRNRAYMYDLYVVQRLSTTKIGNLLGLSAGTVMTGLMQCNIFLRTPKEGLTGITYPSHRGPNHRAWKGGITGLRKLARGRLNEAWVHPIMKRDGFKCRWCNSVKKIVVHHTRTFESIVKLTKLKLGDCDDMMLLIDAIITEHSLEDGITLCKACHDNHHKINGY